MTLYVDGMDQEESATPMDTDTPAEITLSKEDQDTSLAQKTASNEPAKVRYEWYQTSSHVCISVFQKKLQKEDIDVSMDENSVRFAYSYAIVMKCA